MFHFCQIYGTTHTSHALIRFSLAYLVQNRWCDRHPTMSNSRGPWPPVIGHNEWTNGLKLDQSIIRNRNLTNFRFFIFSPNVLTLNYALLYNSWDLFVFIRIAPISLLIFAFQQKIIKSNYVIVILIPIFFLINYHFLIIRIALLCGINYSYEENKSVGSFILFNYLYEHYNNKWESYHAMILVHVEYDENRSKNSSILLLGT